MAAKGHVGLPLWQISMMLEMVNFSESSLHGYITFFSSAQQSGYIKEKLKS